MSLADAIRDLEDAHQEEMEQEYERGKEDGYEERDNERSQAVREQAEALARVLLDELAQRRVRAELLLLREEAMMTIDEVEQMIREVM